MTADPWFAATLLLGGILVWREWKHRRRAAVLAGSANLITDLLHEERAGNDRWVKIVTARNAEIAKLKAALSSSVLEAP